MYKLLVFFISLVVYQMLVSTCAYAYLDPGTGSMIIQAVLGTIAAVSVSAALLWKRVTFFFKKLFGKFPEDSETK